MVKSYIFKSLTQMINEYRVYKRSVFSDDIFIRCEFSFPFEMFFLCGQLLSIENNKFYYFDRVFEKWKPIPYAISKDMYEELKYEL